MIRKDVVLKRDSMRGWALVAMMLASCALVISIVQPAYNFIAEISQENGDASFEIQTLFMGQFITRIHLVNNGTGTAHNVIIVWTVTGPNQIDYSIKAPDFQKGQRDYIDVPIGYFQLEYGGWNTTQSDLAFEFMCDGYVLPLHFAYQAKRGYVVR